MKCIDAVNCEKALNVEKLHSEIADIRTLYLDTVSARYAFRITNVDLHDEIVE